MLTSTMKPGVFPLLALLLTSAGGGCSSSDAAATSVASGVVIGPADTHCASRPMGIADLRCATARRP